MICFFWTFYSKIVQTELHASLESAKILKCQCAILFERSVRDNSILGYPWLIQFLPRKCLNMKGSTSLFGGIPWIMCFWSGFLVPGRPIWCFLGLPGNHRVPVSGRFGTSFSRENMTYFGSWILTHISLVFWLVQLHAIPDHFLENKWWVDDELHFHVPIFLKICTCRTGMNISRKWLDQAPKNIDLYLLFFLVFQACDLWLFR